MKCHASGFPVPAIVHAATPMLMYIAADLECSPRDIMVATGTRYDSGATSERQLRSVYAIHGVDKSYRINPDLEEGRNLRSLLRALANEFGIRPLRSDRKTRPADWRRFARVALRDEVFQMPLLVRVAREYSSELG